MNVVGHFACNDDNRGWVNANKLSIERAQKINIKHDTIIIAVIKLTTGDNVRNDAEKCFYLTLRVYAPCANM